MHARVADRPTRAHAPHSDLPPLLVRRMIRRRLCFELAASPRIARRFAGFVAMHGLPMRGFNRPPLVRAAPRPLVAPPTDLTATPLVHASLPLVQVRAPLLGIWGLKDIVSLRKI